MHELKIEDLSILMVEPSLAQSKIIISRLKEAGVKSVENCHSISSALERLNGFLPDLVVSAMYFPEGTGTDLVTAMRSDPRLETIPFMLVSSEEKFEYLDPIKQAGVVAILPKPFDGADLKKALISTLDFIEQDDLELDNFDIRDVRILLVDDSNMARRHIGRVLANLGAVRITEAANGRDAIELMQNNEFDLVVTDYNMPVLDGEGLLKYIRTESSQSYVPVIMVTSERNQASLASIRQQGVSAMCDKPFDAAHVKGLFRQLL
jgi:two-component system chemotaxis response regulator CheY